MTKIGEPYSGTWPERPIRYVYEGLRVRYPEAGTSKIIVGTVETIARKTIYIRHDDGSYGWAYIWELSEDKD